MFSFSKKISNLKSLLTLLLTVCLSVAFWGYQYIETIKANKEVSVYIKYDAGSGWEDSAQGRVGDIINVLIAVVNTGNETLSSVNISDQIPYKTNYVANSTQKWEYGDSTWGALADNGGLYDLGDGDGYNYKTGADMQPGYWAYYTYQVQVDEDITLDDQQNNSDLFTHSNTTITTAGIDAQVNSFSAYRTPPNFLFGENAGYISVRPLSTTGITVTDSDITGWIYGENIGWISFNGSGYSVTNDTAGQLDGYAWNEHTGFIDMKGGNHAVTINGNGVIEGYAWSEGLGYINFYDGLDPEVSEYTAQTAWRPKGVTTTFRKTLDTDNNGRIDTIQIATNKNLNDDFTDLKITLSGANLLEGDSSFTASGTDITTGDTANDNIFTFSIPEIASGYNTEAVGTLTIDQNTLLQSFGYATTGLLLTNSSVLHLYDGAGPILENIYYDENNTNTTTDDSVILDFNESPRLLNSQMHPQGILGYGNGKTLGTGAYISTDALPSDQVRIILDNTEVGQLPIQDSDTGSVILGSMIDTSYNPLIFTTSPLIQDINNPRPQTASTKDINADGYIDTVEIIFNENIAISGGSSHDGIFVDGYSIAGSNISGDTLSLTLTQWVDYDTSTQPTITISGSVITDSSSNTNALIDQQINSTDNAGPILVQATRSPNNSGVEDDTILLEFSESVSTAETLADQAFTLPGTGNFDATNSTITAGPGSNKITLLLGTGATAIDEATSTINTIAGTISDGTNTNPAQSAIPFNDINAPVVLEVLSEDRNTDGHTDTFAIIFDEQVTISTGSISIVGATINSLSLETNNKTNDTLTLDINFTESSDQFRTDITNKIINIGVWSVKDVSSNTNSNITQEITLQTDNADPILLGIHAKDTGSILLRFSEDINPGSLPVADFANFSMDNNNKAISSIDVSGDHTTLNSTDSWLDGDAGNIDLVPGAAFTDLNGNTNTTQSGTTFGVWQKFRGYAWAENTGWISLSCQNTGDCNTNSYGIYHTGRIDKPNSISWYAWSEILGYIDFGKYFGDYSNTDGENYGLTIESPAGAGDYAVNGYAWAENGGWISFSGGNVNINTLERYDSSTKAGDFKNYAFGENIWFIHFDPRYLFIREIWSLDTDSDGRIDLLRFFTTDSINDDFSGLSYDLASDNFTLGSLSSQTAYDNIFEITVAEDKGWNTSTLDTFQIQTNTSVRKYGSDTNIDDHMLAVHNRIITDKSGPALVYATLNTHNTDTITDDQITLRFSENISDLSGNVHQYFNVNNGGSLGTNSPLSTGISAQDNTLIATLGDTASSMTINTSTIALESSNVIFDLTSPANGNIGTTPVTITDGTAPLLLSGTTIDADGDGYIDGYDLVFNENIDDSSFDINDISIAGASNLIFSTLIGNDDHLARILFDDGILDSGQTPNITANAGYVSDASVNSNQSLAVVVGEVPQIDGAKPVIWTRSTITDDGDYDGYTDTLSIQFSEDVVYQTSTGQAVTWDYDDWNMIDSINGFDYTTVIGMESLSGTQATITFTDTVWYTNAIDIDYTEDGENALYDLTWNKLNDTAQFAAIDHAEPILLSAAHDLGDTGNINDDLLTINFSEIITVPNNGDAANAYFELYNETGSLWSATIDSGNGSEILVIALSNDSVAPMPGSTKIRPITHMARGIQDNQFENYATGSSIIRAGITINELIYNVANSTDQWFEIYNNNNSAMNIGSYRMGDIDQVTGWAIDEASYRFPALTEIEGKGYLTVARSGTDFYDKYGYLPDLEIINSTGSVIDMILSTDGWTSMTFDVNDDNLFLMNPLGVVLDSVEFGQFNADANHHIWVQQNESLKRKILAQDTDNSSTDFQAVLESAPPKPNIIDVTAPELYYTQSWPVADSIMPERKPTFRMTFTDHNGGWGFENNTVMPDRFSITHTYSGTTTDWTSYFTGNIVADNLIEVDYPSTPYRFEPILSFEYTPLSDLEYGKHTLEYTIKDARGHTSTQSYHFWIDDFQVTHTNHSLNLQTILPNTEEDSDIQTIITVQTYGAGFDILSQGTLLSSGMDTIHNWRDSDYTGYGYNILYNEGVWPLKTVESIPLTQSAILSRDPETTPHDTIQTYVYKIEHVARIDAAYAPGQYSAESSYQVTPKY